MTKSDPFEAYRWRRQIEQMESGFREKASERRQRLQELLEHEDDTMEFERQVMLEVQDFLSESTNAAERFLGEFGPAGEEQFASPAELRDQLESILAEAGSRPSVAPAVAEEEDVAGVASDIGVDGRPRDLQSVLERLRDRRSKRPSMPKPRSAPVGAEEPPLPARPDRNSILASFDQTCNQVSDLLRQRLDEASVTPPAVEEDGAAGEESVAEEGVAGEPSVEEPSVERDAPSAPVAEPPAATEPEVEPDPEPDEDEDGSRSGSESIIEQAWQDVALLRRLSAVLLAKGIVTEAELAGEEDGEREPPIPSDLRQAVPRLIRDVYRLNRLRAVLLEKGIVTEAELSK